MADVLLTYDRSVAALRKIRLACGDFAVVISDAHSVEDVKPIHAAMLDALDALMGQIGAYHFKVAELEKSR